MFFTLHGHNTLVGHRSHLCCTECAAACAAWLAIQRAFLGPQLPWRGGGLTHSLAGVWWWGRRHCCQQATEDLLETSKKNVISQSVCCGCCLPQTCGELFNCCQSEVADVVTIVSHFCWRSLESLLLLMFLRRFMNGAARALFSKEQNTVSSLKRPVWATRWWWGVT